MKRFLTNFQAAPPKIFGEINSISIPLHVEELHVRNVEGVDSYDYLMSLLNNDIAFSKSLKKVIKNKNNSTVVEQLKLLILSCYKKDLGEEFPHAKMNAVLGYGSNAVIQHLGVSEKDGMDYISRIRLIGQNTKKQNEDNVFIQDFRELLSIERYFDQSGLSVPMHRESPGWLCKVTVNNQIDLYFSFTISLKAVTWNDIVEKVFPLMNDNEIDSFLSKTYRLLLEKINTLNDKGFIHGDMKPTNLLWLKQHDGDYEVYLTDFDLLNNLEYIYLYRSYEKEFLEDDTDLIDGRSSRGYHYYPFDTKKEVELAFDSQKANYMKMLIKNPYRVDYWIFQYFANYILNDHMYNFLVELHPETELQPIEQMVSKISENIQSILHEIGLNSSILQDENIVLYEGTLDLLKELPLKTKKQKIK